MQEVLQKDFGVEDNPTEENKMTFKKGDKFILELGEERKIFDEFQIAGTDLYVKKYLLEKLTPYESETQLRDDCLSSVIGRHFDLRDVLDLIGGAWDETGDN